MKPSASMAARKTSRSRRASGSGSALSRAAMEAEGFTGISTEWWHYDAPHWEAYPVVGAAGVAGS